MRFAKPIITTRIVESGMSMVNRHEETGLQVEAGSPEKLAEAIRKLSEGDGYRRYCKNAYKRFKRYFQKKSMINAVVKLIENLYTPST